MGKEISGLNDFKQFFNAFYDAFPDIHWTLDDVIVEGDKVAVRWTLTGTHKGEFIGIPPSGKRVTMWGIEIDNVDGGKFVESWVRLDTLGFMQQLGGLAVARKEKP